MAINRFPLKPPSKGFNKSIYPNCPVVYKIINKTTTRIYVGQTIHFRKRRAHHYHALISNKHCSPYLQNAFNKYGVDDFEIEILEECTKDNICLREQYYIENLRSSNIELGYNILVNSPSPWYGPMKLETKLKIALANTGKVTSLSTRKKQSIAKKGLYVGGKSVNAKAVEKYNVRGILLDKYESISTAARKCKINRRAISNCLVGRSKTAGGFMWRYSNSKNYESS